MSEQVWFYIGAGEHLAGLPGADLTAADRRAAGYPDDVVADTGLYVLPVDAPAYARITAARAQAAVDALTEETPVEEAAAARHALKEAQAAVKMLAAKAPAKAPPPDDPEAPAPVGKTPAPTAPAPAAAEVDPHGKR